MNRNIEYYNKILKLSKGNQKEQSIIIETFNEYEMKMFLNNIKQQSAIFELVPKPLFSDNVPSFFEIIYFDENKMLELEIILENIETCNNNKIIQYTNVNRNTLSVLKKLSKHTGTQLCEDMGGNAYYNKHISVSELLDFVKCIVFSSVNNVEENIYEDKSVNISGDSVSVSGNNNQIANGSNIHQNIKINDDNVFNLMRELVNSNENLSNNILNNINDLENSRGTEEYKAKYIEFMKVITPYINLFSSFIPIITELL